MTDHAETILAAITGIVGNLTTTGNRVGRGSGYSVDAVPALRVNMGAENPGTYNTAFQDEMLDVVITSYVKEVEGTTDSKLNAIRAEVYAALMVNRQLGLAFVHNTIWRGRSAPQRDTEEKDIATQDMNFTVHYRHSLTSTEG